MSELMKMAGLFSDEPEVSNPELAAAGVSALGGAYGMRQGIRNMQGIDDFTSVLMKNPTTGQVPSDIANVHSFPGIDMPQRGIQPSSVPSRLLALIDKYIDGGQRESVRVHAPAVETMRGGLDFSDIVTDAGFDKRRQWQRAVDSYGDYIGTRGGKMRSALGALGLLLGASGLLSGTANVVKGTEERLR